MPGAVTAVETRFPGDASGDYRFTAALTEPDTLTYMAGPCILRLHYPDAVSRLGFGPLPPNHAQSTTSWQFAVVAPLPTPHFPFVPFPLPLG